MQRLAAVGAHIGYIGAAAQIASAERRKRDVAGGAVSRGRGTGAGAPACGAAVGAAGRAGPPALPIGNEPDYSGGVLRKRRQRRARSAALVIGAAQVLIAAAVGAAQTAAGDGPSLEQLVRAAMARDVALEKLQLELRNKQLSVAGRAAGKGFGLSLKLNSPENQGVVGVSADFNKEDDVFSHNYGLSAGVTASLPHPFGSISTTASLNGPLEEPSPPTPAQRKQVELGLAPPSLLMTEDDPWELEGVGSIGLTSSVEQPLNPLFGLDAEPGADLEAAHLVIKAERDVRARVRAITRDILERMKTILEHRRAMRRSEHEIDKMDDDVTRRRDVLQDNRNSYSFQKLLFDLEKERRALDTRNDRLIQDVDAFEQRTGKRGFGPLTETPLKLPAAGAVERAPLVVDAAVGLRVSEHSIREAENGHWPEVTINASYNWREMKLSAGLGFSFTLPILDGGLQQIKSEQRSNAVATARLEGDAARQEFSEALVTNKRKIQDMEDRAWEHGRQTRLAALKVTETKAALAAGVVVPSALAEAVLDHELLALDGEILRVDRWLLKLELDALTDADPLDFTPTPADVR